jgi:capsular polysaccharide biosynthesis protein
MTLSDATSAPSTAEHRQLAIFLRRGWTAIVFGILIGLAGGALVTIVQPKKYTASASVLVTPTGVADSSVVANARTTTAINLDTESRLVTSTSVAQRVQDLDPSTKSLSLTKLTAAVSVTVPANTQILTIRYVASSPTVGAQRANDFANAYLTQRQTDAQDTLNAQINASDTQLTTLNTRLKAVASTIGTLPSTSAQLNFFQAQRALLISQITALTTQLSKLTTTVVTPGRTLTKATAPGKASSPSPVLDLAAGLAVGLLIGLIAAWLRFAVRRRLREPDDVSTKLHLPVLGTVAASGKSALAPIGSEAFENYRRISNVITAAIGRSGILLVTGQSTEICTASVVVNLARALARSGVSVKVMSTDGAESSLARADLLSKDPVLSGTWVGLGNTQQLQRAELDSIRGDSLLIVDAPDPRRSADAQTVGTVSDAVLIVVEARTKTNHTKLLKQLDAVGAPILGAVLVPSAEWWRRASTDGAGVIDGGYPVPMSPSGSGGAGLRDDAPRPDRSSRHRPRSGPADESDATHEPAPVLSASEQLDRARQRVRSRS